MAFVVSKGSGSSLSDSQNNKASLEHESSQSDQDNKECATVIGGVSKQLHLKSQSLDKQLVLRRIRHRKSLNKVKSAFETLLGSQQPNNPQLDTIWFQQHDAFSAP